MLANLGVIDFWTYVVGTLFVILLPGPNTFFVLATSAQRGVKRGYQAAGAVFLGDAILMLLSALGVASLLKAEPLFFQILKYMGAAYLFYLGWGMLRGGLKSWRSPVQMHVAQAEREDVRQPFRKALLLSLSNPKAILFFVSFFIQFVDPGYPHPALSFLVLAVVLETISFCYLSFLIFCGVRMAAWFRQRRRLSASATGGVGALFVGFGVKLATATLT